MEFQSKWDSYNTPPNTSTTSAENSTSKEDDKVDTQPNEEKLVLCVSYTV
jgi:hypothetical protein